MKRTKHVIFQDAAYMMEFHPEHAHHPLFQLPMFQTDRFKKFREEMRDNVSSMISPIDTAIDHAIPGVLHAIKANGLKTDLVLQAQKESIKAIEGGLDRVVQELQGSTFGLVRNQMGKALHAAGDVFTVSNDTNGSNINGNSSTLQQVPTITTPAAMANIRIVTPSEPPFIGYGYEPDWQDVKNIQSVYN
jgi:hypothetical protein